MQLMENVNFADNTLSNVKIILTELDSDMQDERMSGHNQKIDKKSIGVRYIKARLLYIFLIFWAINISVHAPYPFEFF